MNIATKNIAAYARINWATGLLGLNIAFFSGVAVAAIPIQTWTQPNGARVYLVESPAIAMVDVQIDFDAGGRRDPSAQVGLASVTASMLG